MIWREVVPRTIESSTSKTFFPRNLDQKYFADGHNLGVSIQYIEEDKSLGTAGSLRLLPEIQNSHSIIVMNGDVLTKVNLGHFLDFHASHHSKATMGVREYNFQVPYGVLKLDHHRIVPDVNPNPQIEKGNLGK